MGYDNISNLHKETIDCNVTTAQLLHPAKKQKRDHLSTITLAWINTHKGSLKSKHRKRLRVLLDSGCAATLVNSKFLKNLRKKRSTKTTWTTKAGAFTTTEKCKCTFTLPEFHQGREVKWSVYVDESASETSNYDMIIGRDLLEELGIDLVFSNHTMKWDNATVPMRNLSWFEDTKMSDKEEEVYSMHDPNTTEVERIQNILDMKYAPADLEAITEASDHLSTEDKRLLLNLLKRYETLFDGSLGTWKTTPIDLELREDAKPYHAKAYPVPYSQEKKLKEEIARMCELGVLRRTNRSEWGFPAFTIPKKDGTLRSIADFLKRAQ